MLPARGSTPLYTVIFKFVIALMKKLFKRVAFLSPPLIISSLFTKYMLLFDLILLRNTVLIVVQNC